LLGGSVAAMQSMRSWRFSQRGHSAVSESQSSTRAHPTHHRSMET
jgi:hypothetical protein